MNQKRRGFESRWLSRIRIRYKYEYEYKLREKGQDKNTMMEQTCHDQAKVTLPSQISTVPNSRRMLGTVPHLPYRAECGVTDELRYGVHFQSTYSG